MTLKDKLKNIIAQVNPGYSFSYEEVKEMNRKVEKLSRSSSFVFLRAVRSGTYEDRSYRLCKITNMVISFCKFMPMLELDTSNDSLHNYDTREELIDTIESEIVFEFVKKLRSSFESMLLGSIQFAYPEMSMFDGNEISVQLSFRIAEPVC